MNAEIIVCGDDLSSEAAEAIEKKANELAKDIEEALLTQRNLESDASNIVKALVEERKL